MGKVWTSLNPMSIGMYMRGILKNGYNVGITPPIPYPMPISKEKAHKENGTEIVPHQDLEIGEFITYKE